MIEMMQLADFREETACAMAAQGQICYVELARAKGLTAYNMALSDRMKPPVIHQMQLLRTDGRILVRASDNVMVTKVEVVLLDPDRTGVVMKQ